MPVAAIAGKTRRFDREHGADAALADRSQQALKTRTPDTAAGAAEIIVDHLDVDPTELARTIRKPILPALALLIVQKLVDRRLPDVDDGAAREMFSGDLAHRRPPRLQEPRRSRWTGLRSASIAGLSGSAAGPRPARPDRTVPAAAFRDFCCFASYPSGSLFESDGRQARRASISMRSMIRFSRENCGTAASLKRAARSCVIHSGMQAVDPSGCGMTTRSTPR